MKKLCILFILCTCFWEQVSAQIWTWQELEPMPMKTSNNAIAVAEIEGQAYVYSFSGIDESKNFQGIHNRSFRYNVAANEWEELETLPGKGRIAAGASTVKNKIYVIGGYEVFSGGGEKSFAEVHIFDPEENRFLEDGSPIPVPIDDQVQDVWRDSLIYVITGWSNTTNVPDVQIYNPSNNIWMEGTAVPNDTDYMVFGGSGVIIGDTIYYAGGAKIEGSNFLLGSVLRKGAINPDNPREIQWESAEVSLALGYRMGALAINGQATWVGGASIAYNYDGIAYNGSGGVDALNRILFYNPYTGNMRAVDQSFVPVMDMRGVAKLSDLSFMVAGGMEPKQTVSDRCFMLTMLGENYTSIDKESDLDVQVYYNASSDCLTIDMEGIGELEVYDFQGKKVLQEAIDGASVIALNVLRSGLYLAKVKVGEQEIIRRLVK